MTTELWVWAALAVLSFVGSGVMIVEMCVSQEKKGMKP